MPALAAHRSRQRVRARQVLPRGPRARRQAHRRLRRLADARGRARPAVPARSCSAQSRAGLPAARRMAVARAIAATSIAAAPRLFPRWFARRHRRPDRAVRRARRRCRRWRCCRTTVRRRRSAARAWAALFPDRYYLEVQRAGRADDDALVAATVRLAGRDSRCPSSRRTRSSSCGARIFAPTRRGSASPKGYVLADARRPRRSRPSSISRRRPRWPRPSPTFPRRSPTPSPSRSAAT